MQCAVRLIIVGCLAAVALSLVGCESQPSTRTLKYRGDLAIEQRDYASAVEWYEQYLRRLPVDPEVRFRLGTAYLGLDQPSLAREQFIQGLESAPGDAKLIEGIAAALVETGQRDELFRLLRRQAEQTRSVDDYIRYGRFATLVGDADVGEEALLTAARIDEGRTLEPQLALANFYRTIGDSAQELTRLRMALFLDPSNEELITRIAERGEVAGPAFVLQPLERQ